MKLKIPCQIFLRRISQNEIRNSAAAEMKTPSPKPARIPPQPSMRESTGLGGNSATPERIQKADNPVVLLVQSRTPHKSFLFLLEEKNRRAQIKNCEENFFAGWRGFRATAGLTSLLGVLLKKSSSFVQKTPH